MTNAEKMKQIDSLLSHVWMVRAFIKHSDEAEDDEELREVQRDLYDVMLSLGDALNANDPDAYLKQMKKKIKRLVNATTLFTEIQPEISGHTNFKMANASLTSAVSQVQLMLNA